jgi:predicted RNA-binding protein with PUA-like domain
MGRSYWLIKTEPDTYAWSDFLKDKSGRWDGVRNFSARNHLRAMKLGDYALFYHTGKERRVVGIAEVKREYYPDPTATKGDFSSVDFCPVTALSEPVSLSTIKADKRFEEMKLVRSPRLSVQPVTSAEFRAIIKMGATEL